jgi:hypothetical protein
VPPKKKKKKKQKQNKKTKNKEKEMSKEHFVVGYSSKDMGYQSFSGSNTYYHASSDSADSLPKTEP